MPAGKYLLQRDDADGSLLLIRNENGAHVASYVPHQFGQRPHPVRDKPWDLHPERRQYRLWNVWESSGDSISVIAKSKAGRRARMQLTSPTPTGTFASDRDRQARSSTWLSSCRLR